MKPQEIKLEPLSAETFHPFGDVLEAGRDPDMIINAGKCGRFHDLARLDYGDSEGRAGISIFRSEARTLPYTLDLMERHPLGSQAFMPMSPDPFMVLVALDDNGKPGVPRAFLARPLQGVNYLKGTWHGVLAPLTDAAEFIVIDRIGPDDNLVEYELETPYLIVE